MISWFTTIILTFVFFAVALLYASVGNAGASAYLAVMALFGIAPAVMKPTALALNILVASVATIKFYRAGYFSWSIFWPFAITSIPFSFLGGSITLTGSFYKSIVGIILIYAAVRLFLASKTNLAREIKPVKRIWALIFGALIGLLSGLTGLGGGILLSPLLLFMGWAETRQTIGVSAAFILVNSTAGLLGQFTSLYSLPNATPFWAVAVIIGGYIGAEYGSKRLGSVTLRRLLAILLVIAAIKMNLT
jgi:uncharacterized protein